MTQRILERDQAVSHWKQFRRQISKRLRLLGNCTSAKHFIWNIAVDIDQ